MVDTVSVLYAAREKRDNENAVRVRSFMILWMIQYTLIIFVSILLKIEMIPTEIVLFKMRNNYAPLYRMMRAKKVQRAPPTIQKRKIQKPILMPPVIVQFFVL
jgi:hypothetical protein